MHTAKWKLKKGNNKPYTLTEYSKSVEKWIRWILRNKKKYPKWAKIYKNFEFTKYD